MSRKGQFKKRRVPWSKGQTQYPQLNDREWLYGKYWVEGLSVHEIGRIIGCAGKTVQRALKRLGIPRRTNSEANKGEMHWNYGKTCPKATRQKIQKTKGSEESKAKRREANLGEKNPMYGKHPTEATRQKMSDAHKGNDYISKEAKQRLSRTRMGENNPNWNGGTSFLPYCPKFNENFREYVRDKFNRVCFLCGKTEKENGKKLSVHHVNYSKKCLCDEDESCQFVPLCISCHAKTHRNREYWEKAITIKLHEKINGWFI